MVDLTSINQGIVNYFTSGFSKGSLLNVFGWFLFGLVAIGGSVWAYWIYYSNKYIYNKKVEINEIVGDTFVRTGTDKAKTIKLGKGGFQVLYLKKFKTWKLAFGSRVGKSTYVYYILPDGYWYNGKVYANMQEIDKLKGLIPIVTTNPTMRAQYTSLEKQIDSLHGDKKSFWDKYGNWVLSISFILIIGILAYLIYGRIATGMSEFTSLTAQMTKLTEQLNNLAVNLANQNTGLISTK